MPKTVLFHTLGCKVNQYESLRMAQAFAARGYRQAEAGEPASVCVINTCTVTHIADRKSRQLVRRARRDHPEAVVVMVGCYPRTHPLEAAALCEADLVVDNRYKEHLVLWVERFLAGEAGESPAPPLEACFSRGEEGDPVSEGRSRALLKIQDGCDRFCAYCTIPYARGSLESRPLDSILREGESLIQAGFRELVLTGINLALYGADQAGGVDLCRVVEALSALEGDFRIRLGSVEPTVADSAFISRLLDAGDKLCPHLHLSAQSGSDGVLAAMGRPYGREDYLALVAEARRRDPHFAITTDLIAGFPGEKEEDFQRSLDLIRQASFLQVHAFPFSSRPGTLAASMAETVSAGEKKERVGRLMEAAEGARKEYLAALAGANLQVLYEEVLPSRGGQALWKGRDSRYVPIYRPASRGEPLPVAFCRERGGEPFRDGLLTDGDPQEEKR